MLTTAVVAFTKFVGFIIVVACTIVSFYAAIHAVDINSQINVFYGGLLMLLVGIVAGPLYCLVSAYGLTHYLAFTNLGAVLVVIPVLLIWFYMVWTLAAGWLRG